MGKKIKTPKFMTGNLFLVGLGEGQLELNSLKEFKNNAYQDSIQGKLTRGNIVPKNEKAEKYVIFDCYMSEPDIYLGFKIFLYEDGSAVGKSGNFSGNNVDKTTFRGNFKMNSPNRISIWGKEFFGENQNVSYRVLIELK